MPLKDVNLRVRRELLRVIIGNAFWLGVVSLGVALFVIYAVHDAVPMQRYLSWMVLIVLGVVFHFVLSHSWGQTRADADSQILKWELWAATVALTKGIAWGFLTTFVRESGPTLQIICALVLSCLMVALNISYGLSRRIYPFFFVPIFLAQALLFYHHSDSYAVPIVPLWSAFGLLLFLMHRLTAAMNERRLVERFSQENIAAEQRVLLNTLSLGVLVTQRDIIVDCNDRYLQMYGYKREELIGQSTRIFMDSEEDYIDSLQRNSDFFNGRKVERIARRKRADGSLIDVEINLGLVDPSNPDSQVVGTYEDVSERLETERHLRSSQARFGMALDALQSGVWDYDTADQNFFISRRFKQVLGYDEVASLAPHLKRIFFYHDWIEEQDRAAMAEARAAFLAEGKPFDHQYRLKLPDERVIWIRESVLAQMDENGKLVRFTGSITDTTISNKVQEQLRESELLHRSLIETVDSLIWHTDEQGVLTFVNERGANSLYGYEPSAMIGQKITDFSAPESMSMEVNQHFPGLREGLRLLNTEVVHFHKNGKRIYLSVNAVPLFDDAGDFVGVVGINTNITPIKKRQRAFQEAVRLQRLIFDSAGEGIVLERTGRVFRANQAFVDLIGGTLGDIIARSLSTWFENADEWRRIEAQLMTLGNVIKVEQTMRCIDGRTIWVLATGRLAEVQENDEAQGMIWVFSDITAQKQQEEQSWYRANHDELTGLPNRRMLQDRLEQALGHARRESGRVGLLMLDLDGFKEVNDNYGHRFGDEMLRQISERMSADVRQLDTVARMGGDEFVVVLHNVDNIHDIEFMAQRLIERIRQPMEIEGVELTISTSIGISMFPESDESLVGLMHAADMAMYAAKASGKNAYRIAEPMRRSGGTQTKLKLS